MAARMRMTEADLSRLPPAVRTQIEKQLEAQGITVQNSQCVETKTEEQLNEFWANYNPPEVYKGHKKISMLPMVLISIFLMLAFFLLHRHH